LVLQFDFSPATVQFPRTRIDDKVREFSSTALVS
jgi:hypothetical protein